MAVKIDLGPAMRRLTRDLDAYQRQQVPFATAMALNDIGRKAVADLRAGMQTAFDRPTPFTLNSVYLKPATKRDLTAWIGIRDFAGKGTPAWKYLTPEIEGGPRREKRFERKLSDISGGAFVLPGRGMKLDAYGNMSRGQLGQIISRLGVAGDANVSERTSRRLAKQKLIAAASVGRKSDYFVAKSKRDGTPLGVWRLVGPGQVEPVLIFAKKRPTYSPRFDYNAVALKSVSRHQVGAFERALADALRTARPR